jgi:TPP-dependent trihydroxycyclohexane-1,2-dione (THcHDO) dehydratase
MPERAKFYVISNDGKWTIEHLSKNLGTYKTQTEAMDDARKMAKRQHDEGHKAQVLVQGKDKQFRTEWTYGDDPTETPG